ncbi:hypothetical protein ETB97_002374 [Aspergillus alliaceus]|uniref:Uncharacterized protein n=1 Tax=Petromyces alliaceus TaxID=209559 RepID=A0A8H6A1I1_PETAA|nr:hypothetical protein ETB97_002374 [Aspergillus burnettii]
MDTLSLAGLSTNELIFGIRIAGILCRRNSTLEIAAGLAILQILKGDIRVNRGYNLVSVELDIGITVGELCLSELFLVKDGRPRPPAETPGIADVLSRMMLLPASAVLDRASGYDWQEKRPDGELTEPKDPGKVGLSCLSRELFGNPKGAVDMGTSSDRAIVTCMGIELKGFSGRGRVDSSGLVGIQLEVAVKAGGKDEDEEPFRL